MDPDGIRLSEISQIRKEKYYMISLTMELKKQTDRNGCFRAEWLLQVNGNNGEISWSNSENFQL